MINYDKKIEEARNTLDLLKQTKVAYEAWKANPATKIEAAQAGREIQWGDCVEPGWSHYYFYRIKPEPELRNWTPEEALGKKVRAKTTPGSVSLVIMVNADNVFISTGWVSYTGLRKTYEQIDGSPCGVQV